MEIYLSKCEETRDVTSEDIEYLLKKKFRIVRHYDNIKFYSREMKLKEALNLSYEWLEYYEDDDSQGWIELPYTDYEISTLLDLYEEDILDD